MAEPPESSIFFNMMKDFDGQIVRSSEKNILIIHHNALHELTANQQVIYQRIRGRSPDTPAAYRIPPVEFKNMDGLLRKGEHIASVPLFGGLQMVDMKTENVITKFEHGDELWRVVGWGHDSSKDQYTHFATFWRDFWLVYHLLPAGKAEKELAKNLDTLWLYEKKVNEDHHRLTFK